MHTPASNKFPTYLLFPPPPSFYLLLIIYTLIIIFILLFRVFGDGSELIVPMNRIIGAVSKLNEPISKRSTVSFNLIL